MSGEPIIHAVAGAGGSALAAIVTYPLITLTTRAQTTLKKEDKSIVEVVKDIIEKEGVSNLYAGLDSALWGMVITNFVYYYLYEGLKANYDTPNPSTSQLMLSGAYAGAATTTITNPIWVVNTRMMVNDEKGTLKTIKNIVNKEGIKAFFSGLGPSLLLVANPALNYGIYEKLRQVLLSKRKTLSPLETFAIGALSKIVATTVTYPIITIKSRLQLGNKSTEGDSGSAKQQSKPQNPKAYARSLIIHLTRIVRELSVSDLYSGWTLKLLQTTLQNAFLFLFKEQLYTLALVVFSLLRNVKAKA